MAVYLSPGVYTKEKDLSEIVSSVATTSSALVGWSTKGSLVAKLITEKQQFLEEYGDPIPGNDFHYAALAFLEKGNTLWCKRVVEATALYGGSDVYNADASGSTEINGGFTVGASNTSPSYASADEILFKVFAKDPGTWANNIKFDITDIVETTYNGGSTTVTAETEDQYTFTLNVYYKKTSETKYSKVEAWKVSRQSKIDGYGRQLYIEDVINAFSRYIYVSDNTLFADTVVPKYGETIAAPTDGTTTTTFGSAGGINGAEAVAGTVVTGWDAFANADEIDVRILINGGQTDTSVHQKMNTVAEARKDCIAILDMPYNSTSSVENMTAYRDAVAINSSYSALYSPWVTINDSYNDKTLTVSPSGYIAAQFAYNDSVGETWNAPAGFNRGILNVLAIQSVLTQGERDTLYQSQVNPLQKFNGQGNVIWGQKTMQRKASALDRVNVRRLLIVIEKSVAIAMQNYLFEPNNQITRFKIQATVEQFMDDLSARNAFQTEANDKGFLVVVDERNNTPAIIDRNELHLDLFIKPSKAAEFIQVQTIITTSGASFEELVSRGAQF